MRRRKKSKNDLAAEASAAAAAGAAASAAAAATAASAPVKRASQTDTEAERAPPPLKKRRNLSLAKSSRSDTRGGADSGAASGGRAGASDRYQGGRFLDDAPGGSNGSHASAVFSTGAALGPYGRNDGVYKPKPKKRKLAHIAMVSSDEEDSEDDSSGGFVVSDDAPIEVDPDVVDLSTVDDGARGGNDEGSDDDADDTSDDDFQTTGVAYARTHSLTQSSPLSDSLTLCLYRQNRNRSDDARSGTGCEGERQPGSCRGSGPCRHGS